MRRKRFSIRGGSFLEFVFVGVPLIFVLISIFEISRGIWVYNSLSHGVKEGTRFAVVHGNNCSVAPNACTVTAGQICQTILDMAPGLVPAQVVNVRLASRTRTLTFATLPLCIASGTVFPSQTAPTSPDVGGDRGAPVTITARYQFDSALAFFWTGTSGFTFGRLYLAASAEEPIRY
jgi:Flp pilus assembly protein TadG